MFLDLSIAARALSETESGDVEYLRRHKDYSVVVEAKWKSTSRIRLEELKSFVELKNVSDKYPAMLNLDCNHRLVRI